MATRKTMLVLTLSLAAAPWHLAAAKGGFGGGHPHRDPFLGLPPDKATLDTDADGTVSKEEIKASRSTHFKAADADGDGALSLAEFRAWVSQRVEDRSKALDTDGNGSISAEELVGGKTGRKATILSNLLKQGDLDGSGALSQDEFRALAAANSKAGFFFAAMDENGDGTVSEAEYLAPPHHGGHRRKGSGNDSPEPPSAADDA